MTTPVLQAAKQMEIEPSALALLAPAMSRPQAVKALLAAGLVPDALKLLALLLPKRYAVGWVCQCARAAKGLGDEDRAGAALAEKWVRDPSEANRRAAFEFANAGGYQSLGTWIAATAGWAAGSLAPATQKMLVPPADDLTARAAVGAVTMLAALAGEGFEAQRRAYVEQALALLPADEG